MKAKAADMSDKVHEIYPSGNWGGRPTFDSKIGTFSSNLVVIKHARKRGPTRFKVNQRIEFATLKSLIGLSIGMTPPWRKGTIWDIQMERLFIKNY